MSKLLAQGAEAKIFLEGNKIIKDRVSKSYRLPILDEQLRKSRTKKEAKLLEKAGKITDIPKLLKQDKFSLELEYIDGERLSETLNSKQEKEQIQIIKQLGKQVAKLHQADIIHGDLTTSNTILKNKKIYIIDFGLGYISQRIEDKAVDLHLIHQALEAKHYQNHEKLFKSFLSSYKYKDSNKVKKQLKKVESRGRYKH